MFTVNESIQGRILYLTRVGTAMGGPLAHIYIIFLDKNEHKKYYVNTVKKISIHLTI